MTLRTACRSRGRRFPAQATSPIARRRSPPGGHSFASLPTLCIDAALDAAAETGGAMAIPANPSRVGWLTAAAALDAASGTTVLAGHVNAGGLSGALWHLTAIGPGALIVTTDAMGRPTR